MSFDISHCIRAGRLVPAMLLALGICFFGLPAASLADGGTNGAMSMPMGGYSMSGGTSMPMAGYQSQTVVVHISNFSFGNPLTVAPGDTVQWINDDTVAHTVTADGGVFDSGPLAPGASFSLMFSQAGDFPYYCRFHGGPGGQGMSSRVTVAAQAGAPAGQYAAPQGGNNYQAPSYGNSYKAPSYSNTYGAPSYSNTYRAPSYSNTYQAPSYGNRYTPSYSNTYRAPTYGYTYKAPAYNNKYRAPAYGNRYAVPECPSYSPRYPAYRSGSASAYPGYLSMPYSYQMGMQSYPH